MVFRGASATFLESVARTLRSLRSKGVGVFFVTRSAGDVPLDVLARLGNRVQHAMRAATAEDAEALRATVRTFPTPARDLEAVLAGLAPGEAVVTVLGENDVLTPAVVTRLHTRTSRMSPPGQDALNATVHEPPPHAAHATDTRAAGRDASTSADEGLTVEQRTAEDNAKRAAREVDRAHVVEGVDPAHEIEGTEVAARGQRRDGARAAERTDAERSDDGARHRDGRVQEPPAGREAPGSPVFASLARSGGAPVGPAITRSLFGTSAKR
ncbi:helicase HerA-like domain-containing protein [Streptomyces fuscigenes]|uniref:helicase HerA-like domain-containing protein n=1 Tax=Streptomyces fuscigenes TaxID=1528880 RepID=UPI0027DF7038|nr:helicase HerA-like domain-containing protein [Streptomyces fuscigenes]